MKEDWAYTEQCLQPLADSMGHLLAMIRSHVSAGLINAPHWECLLNRALDIPATVAAFPFGFEVPLHDPRPRADFGVSLVGGSRSAKTYRQRGLLEEADPSSMGLAWLLDETDRENSLLHQVVASKMVLEYDIDSESIDMPSYPGVFLYPAGDALAYATGQNNELRAVHDALVFAGGWSRLDAEFQQMKRLYESLYPFTQIRAIGTFPSRKRLMRIAVTGFRKADEVLAFLSRLGWPGCASTVKDIVVFLDQQQAYCYLGLHFDVTADGVGPTLGLSIFAKETEWLKTIEHWIPAIDAIDKQNLALPDKLSELRKWMTGSTTLFTRSGPMALVRGIHHLKFSISNDRLDAVKAYVFFLMMSIRPMGGNS